MVDKKIVNKIVVFGLIITLLVFAIFVIKDIIIPLFFGVLLAYVFSPLYRPLASKIKNKNLATTIFLFLLILLIAIPLWFFLPIFIKEIFEAFLYIQKIDLPSVILKISSMFLSEEVSRVIAVELNLVVSKFFSYSLESMSSVFSNVGDLALKSAVVLFTFFFLTRDSEKISKYLQELSPFSSSTEAKFMGEFRAITNSIVFGQIITGIVQGVALGLALWILGVPKVLFLTILAVILSIIPIIGAWLVWVPVSLVLVVSGQTVNGLILFLYGLLFVSTIDNVLRPLFISKNSNLHIFVAILGTIGGLYAFGIIGLLLGPLVLSYFLIVIDFYKDGKLNELFRE